MTRLTELLNEARLGYGADGAVAWVVLHGKKGDMGLDQTKKNTWRVIASKVPDHVVNGLKDAYDGDLRIDHDGHVYTVDRYRVAGEMYYDVKMWR